MNGDTVDNLERAVGKDLKSLRDIYIGIDPGKSGAVAIILNDGSLYTEKYPDTIHDLVKLMSICSDYNSHCVIEAVHSMPGQGVASTFTFGMNYGIWLGILSCSLIPYKRVTPHKWMKHYGTMPKDRPARKKYIKQLAQERYPKHKVTLYNADAILIAQYCKEIYI